MLSVEASLTKMAVSARNKYLKGNEKNFERKRESYENRMLDRYIQSKSRHTATEPVAKFLFFIFSLTHMRLQQTN